MDGVLRPKMQVLPDSAIVKSAVTHTVAVEQPYYLKAPVKGSKPAGKLPAGSKVRLISKGRGGMVLVEDEAGRRLQTASAGLRII